MFIFQLLLEISEISFKKAIVQYITLRLQHYIQGKSNSFCKHQHET